MGASTRRTSSRVDPPDLAVVEHRDPDVSVDPRDDRGVAARSGSSRDLPVAPSIRTTLLPRSSGTQTSPPATSRLTGLIPTLTVETSLRAGRRRSAKPSRSSCSRPRRSLPSTAIHDAPSPPERTRTQLVGPRVEAVDGPAVVVADPERPAGEADPGRRDARREADRLHDPVRPQADALDGPAVPVGHPDRAERIGEVVASSRRRGSRRAASPSRGRSGRGGPTASRPRASPPRASARTAFGSVGTRLDDRASRRVDPDQLAEASPSVTQTRPAAPATPQGVPGPAPWPRSRFRAAARPRAERQGGRRASSPGHARRLRSAPATSSPKRGSDRRSGSGSPRRRTASSTSRPRRSCEAVLSLHVLMHPKEHPLQHPWIREMRRLSPGAEAGDPRVRLPLLGHHRRLHAPRARRRAADRSRTRSPAFAALPPERAQYELARPTFFYLEEDAGGPESLEREDVRAQIRRQISATAGELRGQQLLDDPAAVQARVVGDARRLLGAVVRRGVGAPRADPRRGGRARAGAATRSSSSARCAPS